MKTPTDKELTEFVAKLINCLFDDEDVVQCWVIPPMVQNIGEGGRYASPDALEDLFFNDPQTSPIIRDLIEEEMEARVWNIRYRTDSSELNFCEFWKYESYGQAEDKNKTKAVALAAFNALGGVV